MYAPDTPLPARTRGVSLVELMVSLVVAMLVGLAAVGSTTMFMAAQRQSVSAGGSMVNTSTALGALRDDVSMAGLGFFGDSSFLCRRLNLSMGAALVQNGTAFTPLQLTRSGTNDQIDVVYGTQVASGANILTNAATAGGSAELRSLLPATVGQAVLLAPETVGDPCAVRTVTAIAPSTIDDPQRLTFGNTGLHNQAVFATTVTYPDRSRVALLGELRWARYRLEGTNLRLERPMGGTDPVILARNVVAFRAEYGITGTAAGATGLETWQNASGGFATLTHATLPRVRALRIGLVTRSPQPEKPNAAGVCEATAAMPTLFGEAVTADVTNWQCFRYRTSIVVVPMRNLVMGLAT
jgi:type IV pilus assembly protein PilW